MLENKILEFTKRRDEIISLRKKGLRLRAIGERYGISAERVRQIVSWKKPAYKTENPIFIGLPQWRKEGRERIRAMVRARDKYTCQDCGLVRRNEDLKPRQKSLDVHHIKGACGKNSRGYDKKKNMGGLITLCHKCHYNRHDFSLRLK